MSDLPILTALSLPAVTTVPSADCIQWSDDGQTILLTENAVLILTPDHGVNVERSSVIKQSLDRITPSTSYRPIGWLRTMIEFDKAPEIHQWAAECGEWGAVALGSLDLSFISVSCSPSNLTDQAGCVYAVLNSNAEVSLYRAVKNHLIGKWIMTYRLLGALREVVEAAEFDTTFQKVLFLQATCIAWSSQADFGICPAANVDGSLLAVGNRAGRVCLFRYQADEESEDSMQCIDSIVVGDRWVTRVAWSQWQSSHPARCFAYLACGSSDGSVTVFTITQSLVSQASDSFIGKQSINFSFNIHDERPCGADKRGISSLKWVDVNKRGPVLVFTKPGTLHLWSPPSLTAAWSGLRTIVLQTQRLSVGSSALSPISGVAYALCQDTLVISLTDGSFHVVAKMSTDPSLDSNDSNIGLTSSALSETARADFVKAEEETMKNLDVNAIHGMSSYDGESFYLWIHEALRPADFNYKHDAKHTSMFVTAQLWQGDSDEHFIDRLEERILRCKVSAGEAPISLLRPAFLHLQNAETFRRFRPRVLGILQRQPQVDDAASLRLPPWTGGLTSDLRRQFRNSLRTQLFGWDSLLSQRLQIALAAFCERQCLDAEAQESFRQTQMNAVSYLWPRLLRILIRHIVAVLPVLTPNDVPFVLRIVVQALLPGTPADVVEEAKGLSSKVQDAVPADFDVNASTLGLDELCPACHAKVSLHDITTATCPHGHVWARCSITSFILSTPMVRTCIGCGRKALLSPRSETPAQNWLPPEAQSWLVEELLRAVRRCFFCGNSFVTLV